MNLEFSSRSSDGEKKIFRWDTWIIALKQTFSPIHESPVIGNWDRPVGTWCIHIKINAIIFSCLQSKHPARECFLTKLFLQGGVVRASPNPQAGGPPLVGCPRLLIQFIRSYPPYRKQFPGRWHCGRKGSWWCLRTWCWGEYLDRGGTR